MRPFILFVFAMLLGQAVFTQCPTLTITGATSICPGSSTTLAASTNIAGNTWAQKADFGGAGRFYAAGFSIGNKGYIGTGDINGAYTDDFWEYDPATGVWTQKANCGGGARAFATGFSIGNKGYIGTGRGNTGNLNDFWEYDPSGNTWTKKADFGGTGRRQATGFSIGNMGYIGTGYDNANRNDFWEYNPAIDTWTQKADVGGTGRSSAVGFSIGTKGYIGTGYEGGYKNDFWEYDPSNNSWTQKANAGTSGRNTAVGFSIGSKGYIGSGYRSVSPTFPNDLLEYDPPTNTWTAKANLGGILRAGAVGFSIGSKGYIGTGGNSINYDKGLWEYTPQYTYQWSPGGETTSSITTTIAGNYTLTITNISGCSANSATATVALKDAPATPAITGTTAICQGASTTLSTVTGNTWTQKANFGGVGRTGAVGFSIGNKGYIGTGQKSAGSADDFWEYDPATDVWTQKANCGGGQRAWGSGFGIGNKGYIGLGTAPSGKDFWEYDPSVNTWTRKADFGGTGRMNAASFSIGDKGYVGTGYSNASFTRDFWEYDPATDTWTQRADFGGVGRMSAVGFSVGNKGYMGTGNNSGGHKKDFWQYNPANDTWTAIADAGTLGRSNAVGFSIGSKGYMGTGFTSAGAASDLLEYDPATNTWTTKAAIGGIARDAATGFSIGSKGYIGTGSYDNGFWEYTPPYTYLWSPGGATTSSITATAAGNYAVITTNLLGCSATSAPTTITVNASPATPTLSVTQPTCALATGTITVTAPTGTGLEYSIDGTTFQSTTAFAGLVANSYTVTVKNAAGCTSTLGTTVNTQPISPATPTLSVTQPTCTLATGTITVTAPTGTGLEYSIDGTNFQSTTAFAGLVANNYTVTVKNTVGCTSTLGTTVNAQPASSAIPTLSVTQPTCTLATGTITVTAPTGTGLEYSIDGTTFQSTTSFAGLVANSYTITVKNAVGCTSTLGTTVNMQPASPAVPTLSVTQPTCTLATGTITVSAPTGTGLEYSIDGTTFQATTAFAGLTANAYTITVKNAVGCTSTLGTTVNAQPASPVAPTMSVTQPTCTLATGTITVSAPIGTGLEYSVDGTSFQTTTAFAGLTANAYTITVKNAVGCTSTIGTTLNAQPASPATPTLSVTQPTCTLATGAISVTAPTGTGLEYSIDGTNFQSTTAFVGLVANNYTVIVKNTVGCTSNLGATVNAQPASPTTPTLSVTQPTCALATGTITVSAPIGTGLEYSVDGTSFQTTTAFAGLTANAYTITVKNAVGCTSTLGTTVNAQPASPATPTLSVTQPTCTLATGTITVTAPTSTGLEYSIDGTTFQTTTAFAGLTANNYTVTVKNAVGCTSTLGATVNAQPASPVTPTLSVTQPTCALATGTIIVTAPTGTGLSYSIDGTTFQSTTAFAGLVANNYTVTVKNAVGCTSTFGATVNAQPASPAIPTLSVTQPTCILATGTITVNTPAGTGLSYSIDGTTFQSTTAFAGLTANNYTVTVKNAVGCTSALGTTVNTQPVSPATPTLSVTQPTCTLTTGTITVTAPTGTGLEYSIDGTTFQSTTSFTGLTANNYTVTVKNAVGCTSMLGTTVNAQPVSPATPTLSVTQPTCTLTTGTITVSTPTGTGLEYSIDGTIFQATTVFAGLTANAYTITVKNAVGCTSTIGTTLNAQPTSPVAPTVSVTQPTCTLATGTITVSTPTGTGLSYSIDGTNFQTTTAFAGLIANSYTVTVKNAVGCTSTLGTTVNAQPASPVIPALSVTQPTCALATGTITVSTPTGTGLSYSIDGTNFQTTTAFAGLVANNYTVTVKNAVGCTSTLGATVNAQPASPAPPTLSVTQPTCALATGTITVTAPTGTGLEYSIDGTIFQTTTVFAGLTANSYTVTVKNAVGCTSTLGATVNAQPASPAIPTLSVTQPTCTLTTGTITVTAPTGTGLSYSIDGTTFQSTTAFAGLTANNYTVTVRNAVGCTSALGATVNAQPVSPAIPTLSVTQPTCILATGTITVTAPTGTGLEYSIDGTNFQTTTAFAGLIANSYTITVKNAAGCTRILGTIVNAQPASPATPTLSVTQPTCALATGTITVNSPVGSDLVYSIDGSNFQPSVVFNGLAANNYMVSVKSSNGCITTAPAAKVNAQPPTPATPVITANSATIFCEGGSVTLSAPAAAAYQWSNNATSQKVTVTATGVYYVKIQNAEGCWSPVSSNVTVTVNPYPVFTITSDKGVSFSKGTATTLTVSATGSINWTPATGLDLPTSFTPVARPLVTTTYKATVTSNAGCATSNDITLTLIDDYKVTPKKIVTLNGDGVNDYFVIENIEAYPNNLLQIFDRSGKLVYEKRQYHNDWNGVVRNRNFINDTYFYVLYIDDKIVKKGSITIIK